MEEKGQEEGTKKEKRKEGGGMGGRSP